MTEDERRRHGIRPDPPVRVVVRVGPAHPHRGHLHEDLVRPGPRPWPLVHLDRARLEQDGCPRRLRTVSRGHDPPGSGGHPCRART
ncbi:hypothetical protein [Ornithinimicrobium kibberense]|uniref:hypothetical protein n=1 Tax=Ornithinimicrobium kibberense TaxID=282060 RepID=UPI00360B93FD